MLKLYYTPLSRPNDSSAAHRLLQLVWEDLMGLAPMPQIVVGERGKPDFAEGLHFSLSHAKTLAVAALCDRPVGVDAETIRPRSPRLHTRALAPAEQTQLAQAPDRDLAFLQFWTLKEAYLKYTGEGLHGLPNDLCFDLSTGRLQDHPEIATGTVRLEGCVVSRCTVGEEKRDIQVLSIAL